MIFYFQSFQGIVVNRIPSNLQSPLRNLLKVSLDSKTFDM